MQSMGYQDKPLAPPLRFGEPAQIARLPYVILPLALVALSLYFPAVCLGAEAIPPEAQFTISEFSVEGNNPLSERDTQTVLAPYTGPQTGFDGLEEAAQALERALLDQGFSFRRVIVPAQQVKDGRVVLRVVDFPLSGIEVDGNAHFTDENVLRSFPRLEVGEVPNPKRLARALIVANAHPSKNVSITFKESETSNALDARLRVDDRKPWQFVASVSNTGTEETGDWRVALGFQYSNLFKRDHVVTLSYTTAPENFQDVQQGGIDYRIPIYKIASWVSAYYVRSDVDTGQIGTFFNVSGAGEFFGVRFTHTLPPVGAYTQEISVGLDSKFFDNEILFQLLPIGVDVRSVPASVRYFGAYQGAKWQGDFAVGYAHNVPDVGDRNDQTSYTLTRLGADVSWDALRASGSLDYQLPRGWLARGIFDAQWGGEPLIPGEQFGIGGINSVRGFEEREVTGDDGFRVSVEAWTPRLFHNLRLVGFVDTGEAFVNRPAAGQIASQFIASVGGGIRWGWRDNVSLVLDVAHVLDGTLLTPSGSAKANVSLFFRY